VQKSDKRSDAVRRAHNEFARWIGELRKFISYPSMSGGYGEQEHLDQAAEWVAATLRSIDLDRVSILPTPGNAIVYGERLSGIPASPTILLYGHYDVTSVEPLDEWDGDPFVARLDGDTLYGRGTTDMKGQIVATFAAVDAVLKSGEIPVNLKFLIEGEEEYSPRHLKEFLREHAEMLQADVCLNPDAGMLNRSQPSIVYSLRGNMGMVLRVEGPVEVLHSGLFGGAVQNPNHVLCDLVSKLHDNAGRVAVPGFYSTVRPLSENDRDLLAEVPLKDEDIIQQTGVEALWGEEGYSVLERIGARPALNVTHIHNPSGKYVIPAVSSANIAVRLVPDQVPEDVCEQLREFIASAAPDTVRWDLSFVSGYQAAYMDLGNPFIPLLSEALQAAWRVKPVFVRDGGGIPAASWIQEILGMDSLLTGFAAPDDNLHAPNEKVHLPTLQKGVEALIHFFYNLETAAEEGQFN
jgi:acetylornithine deacetylase/succinyl-diaminopimelate desuccinylase-like protein